MHIEGRFRKKFLIASVFVYFKSSLKNLPTQFGCSQLGLFAVEPERTKQMHI